MLDSRRDKHNEKKQDRLTLQIIRLHEVSYADCLGAYP